MWPERGFVIYLLLPFSLSLWTSVLSLSVGKVTFACSSRSSIICIAWVQSEPYRLHSIPSNWGEHVVTGSTKFSSVTTWHPRESFDPKLKHEALVISEVRGPFERKVLMHSVTLGPFESKVFTRYNCCWGLLWKQSSLLIHYSCCWAPLKARYFAHYSCKEGPEASASLTFPFKTPLYYITLTKILYENMKPIEHVLLIRYAYFLTSVVHVNTVM